jgi:hypothetical protein
VLKSLPHYWAACAGSSLEWADRIAHRTPPPPFPAPTTSELCAEANARRDIYSPSTVPVTAFRGRYFQQATADVREAVNHMIARATAWTNHNTATSHARHFVRYRLCVVLYDLFFRVSKVGGVVYDLCRIASASQYAFARRSSCDLGGGWWWQVAGAQAIVGLCFWLL